MPEGNGNYDVAVVGAGVAGVCASVAAARAGLRTVLLEKRSVPGGTVTAGFHQYLCGLFANDGERPFSLLNGGLVEEIVDRLNDLSTEDPRVTMGRVEVYAFRSRDLLGVLSELTDSEDLLDVRMGSEVVSLETEDDGIHSLRAKSRDGTHSFSPGAVIDASGEGVILRLCSAIQERTQDSQRQLAGYSIVLSDVDGSDDTLSVKVPYYIREAAENGELPDELRFSTYSPEATPSRGVCRLSIRKERGEDPTEKAESYGKKVHALLARRIKALRRSRIADRSPCVLERDGDLLLGDYVLSEDDVLGARKFPDAAARAAWPIEFWHRDKGPEYRYLEEGQYYEVPIRCLKSRSVGNLFAAGRCVSADRAAQASVRAAGACMALGEAAANAAGGLVRGSGT